MSITGIDASHNEDVLKGGNFDTVIIKITIIRSEIEGHPLKRRGESEEEEERPREKVEDINDMRL